MALAPVRTPPMSVKQRGALRARKSCNGILALLVGLFVAALSAGNEYG